MPLSRKKLIWYVLPSIFSKGIFKITQPTNTTSWSKKYHSEVCLGVLKRISITFCNYLLLRLDWFMQENIPLEEVFRCLNSTREGLTTDGVQKRLELFGYNKLEEKKVEKALKSRFIIYIFRIFISWFPLFFSLMFTGKQNP